MDGWNGLLVIILKGNGLFVDARGAQEGRGGGSIVIIMWIKGREQNDMDYSPNGKKNVCILHHYRLESSGVIWARKSRSV